jgi:hypothetical protein
VWPILVDVYEDQTNWLEHTRDLYRKNKNRESKKEPDTDLRNKDILRPKNTRKDQLNLLSFKEEEETSDLKK